MLSRFESRVLALAGICQAARAVQQIARRGYADPGLLRASLASVLVVDEEEPEVALGGIAGVSAGFDDLMQSKADALLMERVRYVTALIGLEKSLERDDQTASKVRQLLLQMTTTVSGEEPDSVDAIHEMAELYAATLSHLEPKIMVKGEQRFLEREENVEAIRAALLAGVRAAYLFSNLGGKKWHLFFKRKKMAHTAMVLKAQSSQ